MVPVVVGGRICGLGRTLLLLALVGVYAGLFTTTGTVEAGYPMLGSAAPRRLSGVPYGHRERAARRVESLEASLAAGTAPAPSPTLYSPAMSSSRVYHVTDYGADPTGSKDSTAAIARAIADAFRAPPDGTLMPGIANVGGAEVHLDGGLYLISSPVTLPPTGGGNLKIHSGSLRASDDFPTGRYLIELWSKPAPEADKAALSSATSSYDYEYVTLRDLMLDANFRGGGVAVVDSLRTTVDNCYIVHFASDGIWVRAGHETLISNSYIGQHITAGGDPGERNFTGVGINLMGNDNAVTDVVVFSAAVGVMVSGQANTLSGVHCYNKAAGWGGVGIYLKLPGLTQTRIVNCYLDYTGIVSEDPDQLHVSSSFFLGDANVVFRSVKGVVRGVQIVDNMFSGGGGGVDIVRLEGAFTDIEQVFVERNVVEGMALRSTAAMAAAEGNGSTWAFDFSPVLLFPDRIRHVQYSLRCGGSAFPNHALRNVSNNRVLIEADVVVAATVDVMVHQSGESLV